MAISEADVRRAAKEAAARLGDQDATAQQAADDLLDQLAEQARAKGQR